MASLTPAELRSYEADVKNARDTLNQIRGARQEGLAEGIEKGAKMMQINIARNMLSSGMDPEIVSAQTGLSITDISQL